MPGNIDIVDTVWRARKEGACCGGRRKARENRQLFRRLTLSHTLSYFKLSQHPIYPLETRVTVFSTCVPVMSYDCCETERKEGRKEGSFGASDSLISLLEPRKYIIYSISRDWVKRVYEIPVFDQKLVFGERTRYNVSFFLLVPNPR